MSRSGVVIRLILCLVALWLGGLLGFAWRVYSIPTSPAPAEGIVVLTGSAGRISGGLELLKRYPDARMLITGVGDGTAKSEIAAAFSTDEALFDCCIELDRRAQDTVGNAEETARWVRRNTISSLVVVTAAYHMPRSLVEMRRVMENVRLEPLPTRAGEDNPERWWWWNSPTRRRIALEYHKYLFSLVRARLTADIGDLRFR